MTNSITNALLVLLMQHRRRNIHQHWNLSQIGVIQLCWGTCCPFSTSRERRSWQLVWTDSDSPDGEASPQLDVPHAGKPDIFHACSKPTRALLGMKWFEKTLGPTGLVCKIVFARSEWVEGWESSYETLSPPFHALLQHQTTFFTHLEVFWKQAMAPQESKTYDTS